MAVAASPVESARRVPKGSFEEAQRPSELRRWEPTAKAQDEELKGSNVGVRHVACHDDLILTASARPVVKVWKVAEAEVKETQKLRDGAIGSSCVEVLGDDEKTTVCVCYDDGAIGLWDLRASRRQQMLESSPSNSWKAKFLSPYKLVSGGTAGSLAIWDLRTHACSEVGSSQSSSALAKKQDMEPAVKRKKKSDGSAANVAEAPKACSPIFSLAVSPDGKLVGCGRGSGDVSVMHVRTQKWAEDVSVHQGEVEKPVRGLCFDPVSRLLLGGGDDNHVSILDAADWARPQHNGESRWPQLERFSAHRSSISSTVACPDSRHRLVLTTSWDGTVKLWDYSTHAMVRSYKEHSSAVQTAAWARRDKGGHFVTAGTDGHIQVYAAAEA
eukprot:TRINITY_DN34882_c0_g1_i1.p1 TRINITY_DN34882_c0_g1~~TRINITY_DN34882_c0_g1_i1.p1  ORF type:complete len:385 (-),score=57.70 TRINITY_DN34882_c0_g1_i1:109-1263(-)